MKIYTKTGDNGETGYIGGRISKDSLLINCVGELDELNASLGICASILPIDSQLKNMITSIQSTIFEVGSIIANPNLNKEEALQLHSHIQKQIKDLEQSIDNLSEKLPELTNFILPGGSVLGAHMHLARAVCRRAERTYASLVIDKSVKYINQNLLQQGLVYLNRLSDWLFTAARFTNLHEENSETVWKSIN